MNDKTKLIRVGAGTATNTDFTPSLYVYDLTDNTNILCVSKKSRQIYDYRTGKKEEIVTSNDLKKAPTIKETLIYHKDPEGGIKFLGRNDGNSTLIDVTDICIKANTAFNEGLRFGVCSNGMGYVISQNFKLDCTLLTDEEIQTLQSCQYIIIRKDNDSPDIPLLRPNKYDVQKYVEVQNKSGFHKELVKVRIISENTYTDIEYPLTTAFRNDDNSKNNLYWYSGSWVTMVGIDVKVR